MTKFGGVWSRNLDKNAFTTGKPRLEQGLGVRKKLLLTAVFISLLLFSAVAGTVFVQLATANFIQLNWSVESPESRTYSVKTIPLTIKFWVYTYYAKMFGIRTTVSEIFYSIDERANVTVPVAFSIDEENELEIYTAETVLSGLSDGYHTVVAYVKDQNGKFFSRDRTFEVDTALPEISVFSVENKTCDKCIVPLNFTVNESVLKMSYSLDRENNVSIAGNTTLIGLSYGWHNVTVYAVDNAGNIGASKTILFNLTEPKPEPSLNILVTAPIASVVVAGAGLLVYFKKRKRLSI